MVWRGSVERWGERLCVSMYVMIISTGEAVL